LFFCLFLFVLRKALKQEKHFSLHHTKTKQSIRSHNFIYFLSKRITEQKMFARLLILCSILPVLLALPQRFKGKFVYSAEDLKENKEQINYKKLYQQKGYVGDQSEKFFEQRLDHFDRSLTTTFKQRYFINDTFWKGDANAPIFLCVGGEGPPLDRTVLSNSVHCNDMVELAPKHNALMLALEHRYYGPSNPFEDFSTENLKYLNTEQALGDVATFVKMINDDFKLTGANRWVTWGGSYPGMVAALSRFRYPHLIYASVSSSAPLKAAVDYYGYNDVVASSMKAADVGGSEQCLNIIVEAHKEVGEQLKTVDGRRSMEKVFNICVPGMLENEQNRETFAGDGVIYLPAQSNDPACTTNYCNISSICNYLTNEATGSSLDRVAAFAAKQSPACGVPSYEAMIKFWSSPQNPDRTWLYQTCTEWGFYQTCNVGSNCPYTQGLHSTDVDLDICQQAFGIAPEIVKEQIQNALNIYGGDQLQSSRILFTSGEIDPWNANSINVSPNSEEPVQWVLGASHHYWTHPSSPTDTPEINAAREVIWAQVTAWLAAAK
jgi:serine protease 16